MTMTLNQAAKAAGKAKGTILKSIKEGVLSAPKDTKGRYKIDPAELHRVFPLTNNEQSEKPKLTTSNDHENRIKIAELEAEIKALRREVERTDMERERERENLSQHIEDMRTAMARLTDQREEQGRRRFFGLLPAKSG